MSIEAVGRNVVIRPIQEEKKGCLIIPHSQDGKPWEVISTGEEVSSVSIGDHVFVSKHAPQPIGDKAEGLHVLLIDHIYGRQK